MNCDDDECHLFATEPRGQLICPTGECTAQECTLITSTGTNYCRDVFSDDIRTAICDTQTTPLCNLRVGFSESFRQLSPMLPTFHQIMVVDSCTEASSKSTLWADGCCLVFGTKVICDQDPESEDLQ
mmetsp:Transcript_40010/g.59344  ORF Transcript_40010/g.59344 Transcript_40010/m.59344 type:complete len:127 (-) Transcript_40010:62-442(-)